MKRNHIFSIRLTAYAAMLFCAPLLNAVTNQGGGFTATDQTPYGFQDISSSGVRVLAGLDDDSASLNLGFSFTLYGQVYTSLCASTNGFVSFGGCNADFANVDITAASPTGDFATVAPFWTDLTFAAPGSDAVYYQTLGTAPTRRFIVQWNAAFPASGTAPVTFEAIFYESSNQIAFQYKSVSAAANGASATVGVRGATGQTNGNRLAWSYNVPVVSDASAISFATGAFVITAQAGTPQNTSVGAAFATQLQAKVTDSNGLPVSGATVVFTAPASGASGTFASSATVVTNSSGIATAPVFSANGTAGNYSVTATYSTFTTSFNLTNTAAVSYTITSNGGTPQSTLVSTAFASPLQVLVQSGGAPVAGVSITFTAPASGASLVFGGTATVVTNASGIAISPGITANATPGTYLVTASSSGVSSTFTLTNAGIGSLRFVPVTPCRVLDTRNSAGLFGGPSISGGNSRSFVIPNSACSIPANAQAYSVNVAVVPVGQLGYLTLWPTGQTQPFTANLNSDGRVKSAAAIVPAGTNGAISVFASNTTDVILDVNGYFVTASTAGALAYYPLPPCRVSDTRSAAGPLGGPFIPTGGSRTVPIQSSSCGIPASAQAYSLNLAVVPQNTLGYLTAWPTGQTQPFVASLNAVTGAVTSNGAIVPAGANGSIDIFASNQTDLIIDVNGYFAPASPGGISLYNLTPCRVLDSRLPSGTAPFAGVINVNVSGSGCNAPAASQAFVFNATVVPSTTLGYLTLWPQGSSQPFAASLNAVDGAVTGNLAIVPAASGAISAFATNSTFLILDIFGYFAP